MQPLILSLTCARLPQGAAYDELLKSSAETLFESASPDQSIFIYAYGVSTAAKVKTDAGTVLDARTPQPRKDILPPLNIPGVGGVWEIEVRLPNSQTVKTLAGATLFGPLVFSKAVVYDPNGAATNPWPLCIALKLPMILGVTLERMQSSASKSPAVYEDLLKKNLTTLLKGTTPGHMRRGSAVEDPPPEIWIYGCNFDFPNVQVKAADIPNQTLRINRPYCGSIAAIEFDFSVGPLQKKFGFELQQIGVALPTVAELQNASNYLRNAVAMAFGAKVANTASGEESNVWQWPMWLPMPSIDTAAPDQRGYGNAKHLGAETSPNDGGEVRWYLANPFNEQRKPLDKYVQGVAADLQRIARIPFADLGQVWSFETAGLRDKKTLVVPKNIADTLSAIRSAGELCEIDRGRPNPWADDTVNFRPPFEKCYEDTCGYVYDPQAGDPDHDVPPWTPFAYLPAGWVCPYCKHNRNQFKETPDRRHYDRGFAVVWRGDIPSLPLPVNPIAYVKDLAMRLWRPAVGSGAADYTMTVPVPAANAVQLAVERLEDITNELVGRINTTDANGYGVSVKFAFVTKGLSTDHIRTQAGGEPQIHHLGDMPACFDFLEPGKTGIGKYIDFVFNPLDPTGLDVQLHVWMKGKLKLFGKDVIIPEMYFPIGPRLHFAPKPLDLPTAAIFFQEPNYGGAALIAIEPKWLGNVKVHIDANTPANIGSLDVNQLRYTLMDALCNVKRVLDAVNFFPQNACLGQIADVIGRICAIGRSVIDSNGTIENVSDYKFTNDLLGKVFGQDNFNDTISSVVLIGPPYSSSRTVVKCWEHSLRRPDRGRCLRLTMPDGQIVFTIPNFTQISRGYFDQKSLPGPVQNPINFNDLVTGIQIVKE